MADTSVGAGVGASWNQQGFKLINNNWEHQGITDQTQYEVNDITTYSDSLYQCILQSDASVDSSRIPTNATYWKKIGGTGVSGRGIKSFSQTGNTITITLTDDSTFSFTLVQTNNVVSGDSAYVDAAVAKANTALQSVPPEYLTETEGDARYLGTNSSDNFATAAQGALADTALQSVPPEYLTQTKGDLRYLTETEADSTFATIAQGNLADTSIQPSDITISTDGSRLEIDGKVFDPDTADSVEVVGDVLSLKEGTTVISQTNLGIPTKTSDITNDSGYITASAIPSIPTKTSELTNDSGFLTSGLQQSDVSVSGTTLIIGSETFDPQAAAGSAESVVAWLKNSGSKVFNYVDGELSSFTITATDASVWTQAFNLTAGELTSITYTHDSGNESVWEDTVITKTFNDTNGELSSIDYDRS